MKYTAWCFLLIGLLMFGQWGFSFAAGAVPEVTTEPVRLAFHVAAEAVTAVCLIVGGIALLLRKRWAPKFGLIAAGLLAYTVIVSPGYFAQQGQWPLVVMFGVLLALDILSLALLMRVQPAG